MIRSLLASLFLCAAFNSGVVCSEFDGGGNADALTTPTTAAVTAAVPAADASVPDTAALPPPPPFVVRHRSGTLGFISGDTSLFTRPSSPSATADDDRGFGPFVSAPTVLTALSGPDTDESDSNEIGDGATVSLKLRNFKDTLVFLGGLSNFPGRIHEISVFIVKKLEGAPKKDAPKEVAPAAAPSVGTVDTAAEEDMPPLEEVAETDVGASAVPRVGAADTEEDMPLLQKIDASFAQLLLSRVFGNVRVPLAAVEGQSNAAPTAFPDIVHEGE